MCLLLITCFCCYGLANEWPSHLIQAIVQPSVAHRPCDILHLGLCRSMKCFHGWWSYLKLALPSVGACCLEWWLYEGLILMAGWLPNAHVAVAAMGVGFNTTALTYTISQGVGGKHYSQSWHISSFW